MKYFKLKKHIRYFSLHNIPMIGNPEESHVIGLTPEGNKLVKNLLKNTNKGINKGFLEKHQELINEMEKYNYFEGGKKKSCVPKEGNISSAYLHVTNRCNLQCLGCYSWNQVRNRDKDLSLSDIKRILEKLYVSGLKTLIISGGEPLLRGDITEICKYAKELGIQNTRIISNGTMPIERYKRITKYIHEIAISIDGYNEKTSYIRDKGIMPKVLQKLEQCKQFANMHFIVTLHKKNMDKINEYVKLSQSLGIPFNFSILTVNNENDLYKDFILKQEDFSKMASGVEKIEIQEKSQSLSCKVSCNAGKAMISIGSRGEVYPCHMLHQEDLIIGNILNESIADILNSENNVLRDLTVDTLKSCNNCDYKYLCGGGCRARAYLETKDFHGVDSTCSLSKKSIDLFFYKLSRNNSI